MRVIRLEEYQRKKHSTLAWLEKQVERNTKELESRT